MSGTLRAWIQRMRGLLHNHQMDRELDEELASHLEMHVADNVRAGMTPEQARRDALIKLGGVEQTKEDYRDTRGIGWLENILQDLRFGSRMLRKSPGFTTVAVLTLALGIGAEHCYFHCGQLCLDPLIAISRALELIDISARSTSFDIPSFGFSVPDVDDYTRRFIQFCGHGNLSGCAEGSDWRGQLLRSVIVHGLKLTLSGVMIGVISGLALTRFMSSILFGISATDPLTFAGVAAVLTIVALAACYVPAKRATRVDPMIALRYE